MNSDLKIGWAVVVFLAALALSMFLCAVSAHAEILSGNAQRNGGSHAATWENPRGSEYELGHQTNLSDSGAHGGHIYGTHSVAAGGAETSVSKPAARSLVDRIVAVVPSIASKSEPSVDARELAEAVDAVSKGDPRWAALLLTIAASESALSDRIRRGEFREHEGDSYRDKDGSIQHRAWGVLQVHRSAFNASVWGSPLLSDQVREGSRLARGFVGMCKRAGVPFPLGVFRALGNGRSCTQRLKGEERRVALYSKLVRSL